MTRRFALVALAAVVAFAHAMNVSAAPLRVFIRASGCNLRCWFCDTPYTSWQPEGEDWSVEAVVEEVPCQEEGSLLCMCMCMCVRIVLFLYEQKISRR